MSPDLRGEFPRRGDVHWVDLEPIIGSQQRGRRPCVILSDDAVNAVRRTVVVIPLSSSPKVVPPLVILMASQGPQSVAIVDQIRAVDKARIMGGRGRVTDEELAAIVAALREVLVIA